MSRVFAVTPLIHTPASPVYSALTALSIACWYYPTANGGAIIVQNPNGAYAPFLFAQDDGTLQAIVFEGGAGGPGESQSVAALPLNQWTHIVASGATVAAGGDGKTHIYFNGTEVTYSIQHGGGVVSPNSGDGFYFGDDSFGEGMTGNLAEVAVWNKVLSAGQITTLAASTTGAAGVAAANLVGYWHLCGSASPEPDASGNGNSGVLSVPPPAQGPDSPGFNCSGPVPSLPYSSPDCRIFGNFPNKSVNVQGTLTYTVPSVDSRVAAPVDSRTAEPADSRTAANIPGNSRTPGTFGPGD